MDARTIEGEKLILKEMKVSDVDENYHKWMNDPEITKYLESRFQKNTIEKIKASVLVNKPATIGRYGLFILSILTS